MNDSTHGGRAAGSAIEPATGRRRRGPTHRLVAGALCALVAGGAACARSSGSGDVLPDVVVPALDGSGELGLRTIEGPAVINLWATWCEPCKRELPDFQAVHDARGGEARFIGINIGDDAEETATYLAAVGVTFEQYLDLGAEVTDGLQTATLPVTVVVAADGSIDEVHVGPMSRAELNAAIDVVSA